MIHFVKKHRCRTREEMVFECDWCGDTSDFAAHNQWDELDQHSNGRKQFCSTECLDFYVSNGKLAGPSYTVRPDDSWTHRLDALPTPPAADQKGGDE